jgi:hypothetical protein
MFSHAEVSKLDNPRSINKEISTFNIPMHCLFVVQISQPGQNVTSEIANNRFRHGTAMVTDVFVD